MNKNEVVDEIIGNEKNTGSKKLISYAIITGILSVIAVIGIVYFYTQYTTRVSVERGNSLSDLSEKIAENTDINIQNRWDYTQSIASVAIRSKCKTKKELVAATKEALTRASIDELLYMVIDTKGNYYCTDGVEGKWDGNVSIFKEGKIEKQVFIKEMENISIKQPQILFVRKMSEDVKLDDGITIRYVAYVQPLANFAKNMDLSEHKDHQLLQIIDKDGEILYSHNFIKNIPNKQNIDDVLTKSKFLDNGSLKEYRRQIKSREINSKKFVYKGESYYLSYAPIDIDDWGILHVVSEKDLNEDAGQFITYSFYSIVGVSVCICILIILTIYMTMTLKNNNYLLRIKEKSNEALKKAADEANYANKAKSDFLAHMSHDIRTPVNGIVGMTNIAKNNLDDKEKVNKCLDKIIVSSNHLVSLINDVLDMSRIETGKVTIKKAKMNIENIYEQCIAIIGTQAQEHNITLENTLEDVKHFNVIGDELHLKQVLINILSNAVKFTHNDGKIIFSVKEIESNDNKAKYIFNITDNGIGMSEEYQKHVFETFTQEDDGSRTYYQGTGLGMAIAKNFIDLMGGTINVSSKINEGTTFTVELELDIDTDINNMQENMEKGNFENMKVLIAEDNELNQEIMKCMLEQEKIKVDIVSDVKEIIDKFNSSDIGEYNMILMDIMMPEMDGLTATKEIRKLDREDAKNIPIVAMTANAYDEDVKKSLEAGMNEHLTKPIDINRLNEILNKYNK